MALVEVEATGVGNSEEAAGVEVGVSAETEVSVVSSMTSMKMIISIFLTIIWQCVLISN